MGLLAAACRHANVSSELVGLQCNLDQVRNPRRDGGGLMLVYNELQKQPGNTSLVKHRNVGKAPAGQQRKI